MKQIDIHDSGQGAERLRVTSFGNGAAYAFNFGDLNSPMRTLWMDGNDASDIREEFDTAETLHPEKLTREVWLSVLDPYL